MSRTASIGMKIAAATAALLLSTIGLAYAGVDLPGTAAEKAVEKVLGVELPNQAADDSASDEAHGKSDEDHGKSDEAGDEENGKSVSDDVHDVKDSTEERGCEFGQAVSDAAGANRQGDEDNEKDPCDREDGEEHEPQGSRATGEEHSADKGNEDHATKDDHPTKDDKPVNDNEPANDNEPKGGKTTGDDHRSDKPADDDDTEAAEEEGESQGSQDTGVDHSAGAGDKAEEAVANGHANKPTDGDD